MRSVSVSMLLVGLASAIIVVLAGVYVSLTLPGSLPTAITTETYGNPETTAIIPNPNPSASIPYAIVYIPAGAALEGYVANFNPQNITVVVGVNNTVVWKNLDNETHVIASSAGLFTSPALPILASWNYTFMSPGTYVIVDPNYSWMNGTITVDRAS